MRLGAGCPPFRRECDLERGLNSFPKMNLLLCLSRTATRSLQTEYEVFLSPPARETIAVGYMGCTLAPADEYD